MVGFLFVTTTRKHLNGIEGIRELFFEKNEIGWAVTAAGKRRRASQATATGVAQRRLLVRPTTSTVQVCSRQKSLMEVLLGPRYVLVQ
jgi:hypothetical protein